MLPPRGNLITDESGSVLAGMATVNSFPAIFVWTPTTGGDVVVLFRGAFAIGPESVSAHGNGSYIVHCQRGDGFNARADLVTLRLGQDPEHRELGAWSPL